MRQLSIEEKAKRYDEAKERMKDFLKEWEDCGAIAEAMEKARNIFPELKESKDDRIKRDIIEVLRYGLECEESVLMPGATTTLKEATVWLEKQGENGTNGNEREIPNSQQKSKIKYVYTKFREGDVIVEIKPNGDCDPVRVKYVGSSYYSCESDDGKVYLSLPIINQDEYKLIEQNPAWSEEDDQYLLVCKNALAKYQTTDKWDAGIISHWLEDKLKSIRPQTPWKPSDEQLHYLHWIANIKLGDSVVEQEVSKHLNELLEDLKKLKG